MGALRRQAGQKRRRLLAQLLARLERFSTNHDPSAVLEPEAVVEADALLETVSDPTADLEAIRVVGWLHWARYLALEPGDDQQDLAAALALFAPVYQARPDLLPDQVRAYFRREEAIAPNDHEALADRADVLVQAALGTRDRNGLDNGIDLLKRAVAATPTGHRDRARRLSNLRVALRRRYLWTGSPADLDAAIIAGEQAVAATPTGHSDRARYLSDLGTALGTRYDRTGTLADLDAMADVMKQAVAATPADHPDRAVYLSNLGNTLRARFERTGALSDLQAAITVGEQAVAATPTGHPNRALYLSNLGLALRDRFGRFGAMTDLDTAIDIIGEAVAATLPGDRDRTMYLYYLGVTLRTRYERTGALADLDNAIAVTEQAVAATPADHPNRAGRLSNLGVALRRRFERTGALSDLQAAITVGEQAVAASPTGNPNRALCLSNLGATQLARFDRTGNLADLDAAIKAYEQAVAATPADHPDRALYLSNLGASQLARFDRTGNLADLDAAINTGEQAVAATPANHPDRAVYLSNLGATLSARFGRTGTMADLDAAVEAYEQAVAATLADHPDRAVYLSNLGNALRTRFERTGTLADLDNAIAVTEQAVAATPADHPSRAGRLSNLGVALRTRFERTGTTADLDAAVDAIEQAVAATPADHPSRAGRLSDLCATLRTRFERTGTTADLDAAVDAIEQAVAATPADHPRRAGYLTNLGLALRARFGRTGTMADLDAAVDAIEQAVAATPADHPDRAGYLTNLGVALRTRFGRTGATADLDTAITAYEEAVAATPADHPSRVVYLSNLGDALSTRFGRTGTMADLDAAISVSRDAVAVEVASPRLRATAGRVWGRAAAAGQRWPEAVEGYAAAVDMLGRVVPRSLTRADQQNLLAELGALGSDAAACCLHAGRTGRAVELFEQGRGILLGQALDNRVDLTALTRQHPDLARRFTALADKLDRADDNSRSMHADLDDGSVDAFAGATHRALQLRRETADAFDRVIEEIRLQPGFDTFLHPPRLEQFVAAGFGGTLVLINVSAFGSDALILTGATSAPVTPIVVPLPGLSRDAVDQRVIEFLTALGTAASRKEAGQRAAEATLTETLGWLWDQIAGPVLDRLGIHGPPTAGEPWPRLWWCVSGLLSFLPLHAAGHHGTRFDAAPTTVIDRVVSSYIPTIRALVHARRRPPVADRDDSTRIGTISAGGRILAVAMPHTPAASDLPGAQAETDSLRRRFPGRVTVLSGPAATHDSVLRELSAARWAHFACHGLSDLTDPSASHLLLHDWPLTVSDIAQLRLEDADLAFLSACSTAQPGARLADEAIHLVTAFQLAGFRHVIGSLWPIEDQHAAALADYIYTTLSDTSDPARAVHTATRLAAQSMDRPAIGLGFPHPCRCLTPQARPTQHFGTAPVPTVALAERRRPCWRRSRIRLRTWRSPKRPDGCTGRATWCSTTVTSSRRI